MGDIRPMKTYIKPASDQVSPKPQKYFLEKSVAGSHPRMFVIEDDGDILHVANFFDAEIARIACSRLNRDY